MLAVDGTDTRNVAVVSVPAARVSADTVAPLESRTQVVHPLREKPVRSTVMVCDERFETRCT
jgi:hypothetical protein